MDAGLAAVLGALSGAVATTAAALATSRATRAQAQAAREQAEIAARAEHRRQRREPRHGVYREFIAAATALRNYAETRISPRLQDIAAGVIDPPETPELVVTFEEVRECEQLAEQVRSRWVEVVLAGPKPIEEPARKVERMAFHLGLAFRLTNARAGSDPSQALGLNFNLEAALGSRVAQQALSSLSEDLEGFISVALSALDDDGST
ncbi:hypothetical protein ACFVXE_08390 [Streptomyces sp. NPDC058231]|uniref:hypothetical protein n=1 Tax=Streptomyces sp. NPDC058231 TaxID=3346392 RepID=UPI0036ED864E